MSTQIEVIAGIRFMPGITSNCVAAAKSIFSDSRFENSNIGLPNMGTPNPEYATKFNAGVVAEANLIKTSSEQFVFLVDLPMPAITNHFLRFNLP